jgi:hypothetical protein
MTGGPARISTSLALFAWPAVGIEPGGRRRRPLAMRRVLSIIFRLTRVALGLAAGGVLIALLWPDMMGDLYSANSLRHFGGSQDRRLF